MVKGPATGFDKTALTESQDDHILVPFKKKSLNAAFGSHLNLALFESHLSQQCTSVTNH